MGDAVGSQREDIRDREMNYLGQRNRETGEGLGGCSLSDSLLLMKTPE